MNWPQDLIFCVNPVTTDCDEKCDNCGLNTSQKELKSEPHVYDLYCNDYGPYDSCAICLIYARMGYIEGLPPKMYKCINCGGFYIGDICTYCKGVYQRVETFPR